MMELIISDRLENVPHMNFLFIARDEAVEFLSQSVSVVCLNYVLKRDAALSNFTKNLQLEDRSELRNGSVFNSLSLFPPSSLTNVAERAQKSTPGVTIKKAISYG